MADFKLGRLKFKWRGDWAVSTAYVVDDIVKYGGNCYVVVSNHTSQASIANFYTDLTAGKYQLHTEGLFFKGNWATTTFYKLNDLVKYGGFQYRCTTQHTSGAANENFDRTKFEVYTDGLQWEDTYNASTVYQDGDVVSYGGYTYVYKADTPQSGQTPTDNAIWDVLTTGWKALGEYSHGTAYKTGDTVQYGGNNYVATANHSNQYPAVQSTGATNTSYWTLNIEGYNNRGTYNSSTVYNIGDVVRYTSSSYQQLKDRQTNVTPGSDGTVWGLIAQGDSGAVMNTRGDIIVQNASEAARLSIGTVGSVLTTDGKDPKWSNAEGRNVYYVSNSGSDSNPGTEYLPFRTIKQGCKIASSGDVVEIDTIAGGTGGTPAVYDVVQTSSSGSGLGVQARVTTDGSSTPTVVITNGGSGHSAGDDITIAGSQLGSSSNLTFNIVSVSVGDVVYVKNGVYREKLPLNVHAGVTIQGESLRGTEVRPATGTGYQIATHTQTGGAVDASNGTAGTYNYVHSSEDWGTKYAITKVDNDTFTITLGTSTFAHTYVSGGQVRKESDGTKLTISDCPYNNTTGVLTVTTSAAHGLVNGNEIRLRDILYNCDNGQKTYPRKGHGAIFNVVQTADSSSPTVTLYHGGYEYAVGDLIVVPKASIGAPTTDMIVSVVSVENNNASNMWLTNNATNIVQMTFKGLTGVPNAGGTGKAAVVSLSPDGNITTTSPYIQNCSSVNASATGIQIDGNIHSAGNKSILANDFTQINSDGIGVHALAGGRGEMVSVFTYYCAKSFYAHSGGFIRALNCSSGYGEKGAVSEGEDPNETPVIVQTNGEMLTWDSNGFVGAATASDVQDSITTNGSGTATIVGATSGATATFFRYNISTQVLHIKSRSGTFQNGETITITKENSTTFQVALKSSNAQTGQYGGLISVKTSTTALTSTGIIKTGANVKFAADSNYYRVSAVTEENTTAETATIRLTANIQSTSSIAANNSTRITSKFSNLRLTGHDFLNIGTGDIVTSNYPSDASQVPDQADEVDELTGGRVYYTSTDQDGDFRVGDLFRIQQSTGIATLNADAFDLSGLSELQLGSIGAELGATINEFSTDETLGGDSNTAIPTERAIIGYTQRDQMGTGHLVPPTGTTAQRPTGGNLKTGGIRYNSSLVTWEGYNGTQWTGLGGGNPWATFTADGSTALTVAANDRYYVDTTAAAQTLTLPAAPQGGDQVSIVDLAGTFDTNNLTIARNGKKIMGATADMTISTENAGIQLVYTGATQGWKLTQNF